MNTNEHKWNTSERHSDVIKFKISENQAFKLNLNLKKVWHEHFAVFGSL